MTTSSTTLLGLALPVTGELSNTWGNVVNDSITNLVDSAISGTTTLSSDADVTLTTTTLSANQARQAIILWTAGGTVTRTITAPAQSKPYIVINKTSSSQSIKIVGVGPTTGVTIVAGTAALVAWNGVDFVTVSVTATTGILPVANGGTGLASGTSGGVLAYTATGTLASSGLLAASALVLGGGAGAAPTTTTTGAGVVTALGIAPGSVGGMVLTGGAFSGTSVTASNLTSGRVTYAGTAGLLQDSANLTFNGTTLTANTIGAFTLGGTVAGGGNQLNNVIIGTTTPLAGAFTTITGGGRLQLTALGSPPASGSGLELGGGSSPIIFSYNRTSSAYLPLDLTASAFGWSISGTSIGTFSSTGINGMAIGATTPSTGAFTTLSATGDLTLSGTVGRVVSDANSKRVLIAGGSTATTTTGAYAIFEGYDYGGAGAGGAISLVSAAGTTNPITMSVGGTTRGVFSSTGLAVTGTLNATGQIRSTGALSTNATGIALSYEGTGNSNITAHGVDNVTRGIIRFRLDSANGTIGNYYATLNDTGLAVTGTLSATGAIKSTGANLANEADCVKLSFEGTSASAINAYGTDASTAGSFAINSKSSNGSVSGTIISGKAAQTLALEGASRTTGTGIAFPATQSASTDANTLDDYEEGTWTPTIYFGGASVGVTYTTQTGTYTKVGNIVRLTANITLSNKGSSTTYAEVRGIPFAAPTILGNGAGVVPYYGSMLGLTGTMTVDVYQSTISLRIFGAVQPASVQDTNFTNTSTITFTCTYYV